jgi:HEAT repeat protein
VPVLIQALQDDHERVRRAAAETLGGIGPGAKEAVASPNSSLER